jgi:hypothetical protein
MKLLEILNLRGFPIAATKIIRNTINREYIEKLISVGYFDLYQSIQKIDKFKNSKYIVSFTDLEGTKSLLYGVFKINGVKDIFDLPEELAAIEKPEKWIPGKYKQYEMERVNVLNDLEGRLVIDWGTSTIQWCQKDLNKEIVEILPDGFFKPFPGYQDVLLSFEELAKVVNNPDANRQWKSMLSNVYGVYLILDKKTGKQYVGSAYGKEGIWGRWSTYVLTKHGNNKILIELLEQSAEEYKNFQFSILDVLPNSILKESVIQKESRIKEKLGSIAFGLNAN